MRHSVLAFVAFLIATPASAQWTPPRTPDGHPDFQGIWLNNRATPLERPKALEGKPFLTDEQVAELKRRAARLFDGGGSSDFAGGDNFFLALLENPERYKNPNVTGGSDAMIDRVIDNRTSLIVDPTDGKLPPLTTDGRERNARSPSATGAGERLPAGPEDLSNALRCLTYGVPRLGVNNISGAGPLGYYQIVQAPGYVVLSLEAIHEARIVPIDGRPHLPARVSQWSGDSRGRWDKDTLVVDTSNFSRSTNFMGSSEHLHVVERFTLASRDTLNYVITIEDATTWAKPWTAELHLERSADRILEYACHEGNYDLMHGFLAGARSREKAAANTLKR